MWQPLSSVMQFYVQASKLPSWQAEGIRGLSSVMQHKEEAVKTMYRPDRAEKES